MTEITRREGALDVPDGLPAGIDLGRINNREQAIAQFGRPYVEALTDHALLGDDVAYRAMLVSPEIDTTSALMMADSQFDEACDLEPEDAAEIHTAPPQEADGGGR